MGFINSYKRLEKLCGEILNDDRRVSAYIDEMENTPKGSFYVEYWKTDLEKLKHYRWVRNKISHDPDYSEENLCNSEDEEWIDSFYDRIINRTDPLAIYRKEVERYKKKMYEQAKSEKNPQEKENIPQKAPRKSVGCATYLICGILAIILIIILTLF